jgi:hypothetical protein
MDTFATCMALCLMDILGFNLEALCNNVSAIQYGRGKAKVCVKHVGRENAQN